MLKRAALIYFKEGVTDEEARAALESIENVLHDPRQFDRHHTTTLVGDYVQEYDDEYGGPVWYIP